MFNLELGLMPFDFLSGVPSFPQYKLLLDSAEFKTQEEFSDDFLVRHRKELRAYYAKKWVRDPFHQWSRQWEYPYVFSRIRSAADPGSPRRILDAGSGITFFPYFISAQSEFVEVHCADNDGALEPVFARVNSTGRNNVTFSCSDIGSLRYARDWFDIVYCISVLEHTQEYTAIVQEFHRVLRPGGKLVLTFDISLDGDGEITIDRAARLLDTICRDFVLEEDFTPDLESEVGRGDILTTLSARSIDAGLLPWRFPAYVYQFQSLLMRGRVRPWPPLLTVFCITLTKPIH